MKSIAPYKVGIVARDVDALVGFYTGVLGMRVFGDVSVPEALGSASGLSPRGYRVVRLSTRSGQRLKIACAPGTSDGKAASAFPMQASNGFYATFLVSAIDTLWSRLAQAGVTLCSASVIDVRPGVKLFLARDPEDNFLEFVEYADPDSYLREPSG